MTGGITEVNPPAQPFPDTTFAAAVSLGGDCEPAHWLRAFGRHAVRGPFDWLVTPLDALVTILAENGARLGTEFALANAGTSVRCRSYGVLYHHEFPRSAGNAVVFDAAAIEACRGKLVHKWINLVTACTHASTDGKPLLFLWLGVGTGLSRGPIKTDLAPLRAADLNALAGALTACFPRLDFRLLALLPDDPSGVPPTLAVPFGTLDPRVALLPLPRGADPAWATDAPTWHRMLAGLRFDLPAEATSLAETLHWSGEMNASTFISS